MPLLTLKEAFRPSAVILIRRSLSSSMANRSVGRNSVQAIRVVGRARCSAININDSVSSLISSFTDELRLTIRWAGYVTPRVEPSFATKAV